MGRRRWVTEQQFLDLVGATNLIPGPSSTELAIYLGWRRAGWRGLVAAGVCFVAPAFAIVLGLAVLYDRYGTTPVATDLLYGVTPVVVAIIAHALVLLGRTAIKNVGLAIVGLAALAGYLAGLHPLLLLALGAVGWLTVTGGRRLRQPLRLHRRHPGRSRPGRLLAAARISVGRRLRLGQPDDGVLDLPQAGLGGVRQRLCPARLPPRRPGRRACR